MARALILALSLSGCVQNGYVLRSLSVDAAPRSVGFTFTFDNTNLPETGGCLEVCVVE